MEFGAVSEAVLRFCGDLPELLRRAHSDGEVRYPVVRRASIKDVAESLGVPHTEIHGLLLLTSAGAPREVGFGHALQPGEVLDISGPGGPVDAMRDGLLRPALPHGLRFVVDENAAGLVPLLRGLGLDTAYDRCWTDERIAEIAEAEGRVVLSRDRALLKRSCIAHGRLVRANLPDDQLREVLALYPIPSEAVRFSRCLRCNVLLRPVEKAAILHRLEPRTKRYYHRFQMCPSCERIYWPGSHQERMLERYARLGLSFP